MMGFLGSFPKIRYFQGLEMTILSVFEPGFQITDLKFWPGFRQTTCSRLAPSSLLARNQGGRRVYYVVLYVNINLSSHLLPTLSQQLHLHQDLHEMHIAGD